MGTCDCIIRDIIENEDQRLSLNILPRGSASDGAQASTPPGAAAAAPAPAAAAGGSGVSGARPSLGTLVVSAEQGKEAEEDAEEEIVSDGVESKQAETSDADARSQVTVSFVGFGPLLTLHSAVIICPARRTSSQEPNIQIAHSGSHV